MVQIIFSSLKAAMARLVARQAPVDTVDTMTARERADLPPHHPRCEVC